MLGALAVPLAGCRIRLESDAPAFLPEPSPDPAGPAILTERRRVAGLVAACVGVDDPVVARWRPVQVAQLAALDGALAALDPPLSPAPAPRTSAPARRADLGDLADLEFADLDGPGLVALDGLAPRAAGVVVASHAQRAVVLDALRAAGAPGGAALPPLPWRAASEELAAHLIGAIRSAAYGLEVAAAQSDAARRTPMLDGLRSLRLAEAGLAAGVHDLPPRPLGYPLPGPVTSPSQAARLANTVLDRLVAVVLDAVVPTATALHDADDAGDESGGDPPPPGADAQPTVAPEAIIPSGGPYSGASASLLRLTSLAETTRLRCGGAVRPLPGLRPAAAPAAPPTTSPTADAARPSPRSASPKTANPPATTSPPTTPRARTRASTPPPRG
ncbi:hypothetical protein [Mobilicoccus massiliensis]|uniref:hypothetical protein n=1 Tax=Mobilicoccus massiliensis TaxID=1522310 RepID=UPI00058AE2E3|nr:hypothetical protein [Mobilicoccus massiliensis]